MRRIILVLLFCLLNGIVAPASADAEKAAPLSKTLVDVFAASPDLTTMNRLLTETGLAISLSDGDFSVFAPTDAAFASLPAEKLAFLEQPEHRDRLRGVLQHWIVARIDPAQLGTGPALILTAFDRLPLTIDRSASPPCLQGAPIALPPHPAPNGNIYTLSRLPTLDDSLFEP